MEEREALEQTDADCSGSTLTVPWVSPAGSLRFTSRLDNSPDLRKLSGRGTQQGLSKLLSFLPLR